MSVQNFFHNLANCGKVLYNNVMELKKNYKILAIESSCDETSCAIVEDGRTVLSCVISSQIDIHTLFGGVVPEVASRNHITAIDNIVKEALKKANLTFNDIDAIAVTYGAGLVGCLLVGISYAKGLSFALNKPLIAVNHIHGHIASNYITHKNLVPPFLCLLTSGGHTAIIEVPEYDKHNIIGNTLDDAVGESFDKVARVLGLGYPGGPKVSKMAENGNTDIQFVKTKDTLGYNFSFSGKKTAVLNFIHNLEQKNLPIPTEDICASYQKWVVDDLVSKTIKAATEKNYNTIVLAGGVSANNLLRQTMKEECKNKNLTCLFPDMQYCTDNAAMIGSAAYFQLLQSQHFADFSLAPAPGLPL